MKCLVVCSATMSLMINLIAKSSAAQNTVGGDTAEPKELIWRKWMASVNQIVIGDKAGQLFGIHGSPEDTPKKARKDT